MLPHHQCWCPQVDVSQSVFSIFFSVWVLLNCYCSVILAFTISQIKAKWFYLNVSHVYYIFHVFETFPVWSIPLLLHPNLSPQNHCMTISLQFLLQLGTEDSESHWPTKEADVDLPCLMSSVPYWHICKEQLSSVLQKPQALRLWDHTVLPGWVLFLLLYQENHHTLFRLSFALGKLRITF